MLNSIFIVIYFLDVQRYFSIVLDATITFNLLKYINIDYPENLHEFFFISEDFKMNFDILKIKSRRSQDHLAIASNELNFLGQTYILYQQTPKPKFVMYDKTSSFLQNGFNAAFCTLISLMASLFLRISLDCLRNHKTKKN